MRPHRIRAAGLHDVDGLARLASEFRAYLAVATPDEAVLADRIAAVLREPDCAFLVAEHGPGELAGYVQIRTRLSFWIGGLEAELEDVFVARRVRRSGLGRDLVQAALAWCAGRGCIEVGLHTNERNAAALALYREQGFGSEVARWDGGRRVWLSRRLGAAEAGSQ